MRRGHSPYERICPKWWLARRIHEESFPVHQGLTVCLSVLILDDGRRVQEMAKGADNLCPHGVHRAWFPFDRLWLYQLSQFAVFDTCHIRSKRSPCSSKYVENINEGVEWTDCVAKTENNGETNRVDEDQERKRGNGTAIIDGDFFDRFPERDEGLVVLLERTANMPISVTRVDD